MDNLNDAHELLLREMHRKRLSPVWAKLEIVICLTVAAIGQLIAIREVVTQPDPITAPTAAGVVLFVLGLYLAMAGHRSHLYQSNNRLAAYLIAKMQQVNEIK